jgi:hypothetical protein
MTSSVELVLRWGAWPGAVYGLISRGKAKGVRIPAPSTTEALS